MRAAALGVLAIGMLATAGCAESADSETASATPATSAAPQIDERYQLTLQRAWDLAGDGDSPVVHCRLVADHVRDTLQTEQPADAVQVAEACYVQAIVRYLDAELDAIEAGGSCINPITVMSHHRNQLGPFLDEIGEDRDAYDARIAAATGDRVRAACPDYAASILTDGYSR